MTTGTEHESEYPSVNARKIAHASMALKIHSCSLPYFLALFQSSMYLHTCTVKQTVLIPDLIFRHFHNLSAHLICPCLSFGMVVLTVFSITTLQLLYSLLEVKGHSLSFRITLLLRWRVRAQALWIESVGGRGPCLPRLTLRMEIRNKSFFRPLWKHSASLQSKSKLSEAFR